MGLENFNWEQPQASQEDKVEVFESEAEHERAQELLDVEAVKNYQKVGEGHNGVIGSVDLLALERSYAEAADKSELTDEKWRTVFKESFESLPDEDDKVAIKMLKIYSDSKAENEAEVQSKVYGLIEEAQQGGVGAKYATVPKVYFNRKVDLDAHPELRDKLNQDHIAAEKSVNILSMDFLRGEDLDRYLHTEALIAKGYSPEECQGRDYQWLQLQLSSQGIKGFNMVVGDGGLLEKEVAQRTNKTNLESLAKFLAQEKPGLLAPEVFEKLKNTLDLAHEHNIFHRDLHERNVFLQLGEEREVSEVSIIDWGEAKIFSGMDNLSQVEKDQIVYDDGDQKRLSDAAIFKYERLLGPELGDKKDEKLLAVESALGVLAMVKELVGKEELVGDKRQVAYEEMRSELSYLLEEPEAKNFLDNVEREFDYFSGTVTMDDIKKLEVKLGLWLEFIKDHQELVDEERLAEYLEAKMPSNLALKSSQKKVVEYLKIKTKN
jgi:serine/threonine protein kinase